MSFEIKNIKDNNLEGKYSKDSFYNNADYCFYALSSREHTNEGFPLTKVSDSIGKYIKRLSNITNFAIKEIIEIYSYENLLAVVYNRKKIMELEQLSSFEIDTIRIEDKEVTIYFDSYS